MISKIRRSDPVATVHAWKACERKLSRVRVPPPPPMFSFRKKIIGKDNRKIIFLLCGWPGKIWHYFLTAKILEKQGFKCIIYEYDNTIFSSSIKATIANTNAVKNDILKQIKILKKNSFNKFAIFGTSYGTLISFMVANKEKSVTDLILNLSSIDLSETVWTWNKGKDSQIKKELIKQGVSLKLLKKKWSELSPINNMNNLKNTRILFYQAKNDEVFPLRLQHQLLLRLKTITPNIKIVENLNRKHRISALVNLLNHKVYTNFLINYRDLKN